MIEESDKMDLHLEKLLFIKDFTSVWEMTVETSAVQNDKKNCSSIALMRKISKKILLEAQRKSLSNNNKRDFIDDENKNETIWQAWMKVIVQRKIKIQCFNLI